LTEKEKSEYREAIKQDSNKNFDSEFKRTTDLERLVIDKYGFKGLLLLFENKNSANYYNLGDFPKNCPWAPLNTKTKIEFIDANFALIHSRIPTLINVLKERCLFIFAEKKEDKWFLNYLMHMQLYDGRNYYKIYSGGAPNPDPKENEVLLKYQWFIPTELYDLYLIHDGFGEADGANCVMNSYEIFVMAALMNPICKEQNVYPDDYKFEELLEFYPDGGGNAQCFWKNKNTTIDWDHETWELSGECGFFEFIDDHMSEIDEE
jgi:hypothetical protein